MPCGAGKGRTARGRSNTKKLIQWVEWIDNESSTCPYCRQKSAERTPPGQPVIVRNNKGEPCESCRIELREENEDAAAVYMITRRQYVTRHNGRLDVIVDLSIPAIESAMRIIGVKDQRDCLRKVQQLFHHFLGEQQNDED